MGSDNPEKTHRSVGHAMVKLKVAKAKTKQRLMLCFQRIKILWNSIKATFSRILVITHALLTVWQVTVVLGAWYWVVSPWLACMLVEIGLVVFMRKGVEWKWFQPCILIYLMVELPSVWLLELERVSQVQIEHNSTQVILNDILSEHKGVGNSKLLGLKIPHALWTLLLEQSMMVLIIIARWLMPKGELTRDQLSALLLYYLGTASDLVDFFSVLAEDDKFLLNTTFVYSVLATWSWSMIQFVFVVTMTSEKSEDTPGSGDAEEGELHHYSSQQNLLQNNAKPQTCFPKFRCKLGAILESEAWAITISMVFQDGPYAVVRSLCLFYWGIRTYTNYFFTFKNILILCLQSYRLVSVYGEYKKKKANELLRKTHQATINLAAVHAFKKAGKRRKKLAHDSDSDMSEIDSPKVKHKPNGVATCVNKSHVESDSDYDSPVEYIPEKKISKIPNGVIRSKSCAIHEDTTDTESEISRHSTAMSRQSTEMSHQSTQMARQTTAISRESTVISRQSTNMSRQTTDSDISYIRQETETDLDCSAHTSLSNQNTVRLNLSVTCQSSGQMNFVKSAGFAAKDESTDSDSQTSKHTAASPDSSTQMPEISSYKPQLKSKDRRGGISKSFKRNNHVTRGHVRLDEDEMTEVSV